MYAKWWLSAAAQFRAIQARNPFANADPARLYVTLLAATPAPPLASALLEAGRTRDQVVIVDNTVYIHCATRFSDVGANNTPAERVTGAQIGRLRRQIVRLRALAGELLVGTSLGAPAAAGRHLAVSEAASGLVGL